MDSNGNIWFVNSSNNSVTEFAKANSYAATTIYNGNTNFSSPNAIAIDNNNNIWVTNPGNNSVTELMASSSYSATSAVNISGGTTSFNAPLGIAVDHNGNIWVTDTGYTAPYGPSSSVCDFCLLPSGFNGVTELTAASGYSATSAVNISGGAANFSGPIATAIDHNGNVWVTITGYNIPYVPSGSGCGIITPSCPAPSGFNGVTELKAASGYSASSANNFGNTQGPYSMGLAVDSLNNIWLTDTETALSYLPNKFAGNSLTVLTSVSGYAASSDVQFSGGSTNFSSPTTIVVDESDNIWVASPGNNSVTELTQASNYAVGSAVNFGGNNTGFNSPSGIAVDEQGNVWVTSSGSNTITELVGAAAPTPFSVPLK